MLDHDLGPGSMAKRRRTFLNSPKLVWPAVVLLTVVDGAGLYLLSRDDAPKPPPAPATPPKPKPPPPPAMIHPPAVADMLRSGTLIVISKKTQNMFVFSDGMLWATTPISTGKRRHETPSGVFPILQKHKLHRSNIYSGAPMPYMQRLTWDGIALHAGWVPGYAASHGCVRVPRAMAQSLFKLTNMSKTTVVIGDDPLETDLHAQHYALTQNLPVHSALAPPAEPPRVTPPAPSPVELALSAVTRLRIAAAAAAPAPSLATPATVPAPMAGQTIQLAAAASQADAEAHWVRLLKDRPDMSRFTKRVEPATVNARQVYRLRISGSDAQSYCEKLKSAGINCLNVS